MQQCVHQDGSPRTTTCHIRQDVVRGVPGQYRGKVTSTGMPNVWKCPEIITSSAYHQILHLAVERRGVMMAVGPIIGKGPIPPHVARSLVLSFSAPPHHG
jgi:hypothetical protein